MFKKLKDKIGEEFKQAPLKFPVSVQQLAQVISPSPSVNSLSDNNASSSLTYPTDIPNVSTDFFSIGGEEDSQDGVAKMQLTLQNVELTAASPSNMTHNMSRSRRSSLSSVTSEASSLFPIFESGLNQNFLQSDLESEMEDGMSGQIEKISKEQLYQSFKKVLNRYNKYKGRYTELMKHYKELQHDNFKTKNVLQESQDKALRRMAELREQCQLEQKAKAHLEESLRNDVEERDHIIDTLKTKISLLSNGEENVQLIDLDNTSGANSEKNSQELNQLKAQNQDLQKEVERLKKIKETACHLIHRCDTTINEATEDVRSDNLKQKMSELKSEIQKMKSENESLSHLLSKNIITDEDKKLQISADNNLLTDLGNLESSQEDQKTDEKDKKIEKLNTLLLKCKEKINGLNAEIKTKDLVIENNNKTINELKEEVQTVKAREEENALSVAENKKAIHEELDAKEKQIKALTKELKTKENKFIKEKEDTITNYENAIRDLKADLGKEIKHKTEENKKLIEDLKAKEIVSGSLDKLKTMEDSFTHIVEFVKSKSSAFEDFAKSKTTEIEKAHQKLEEKVATVGKNLSQLLQVKQITNKNEGDKEMFREQKVFDVQSEIKSPNYEIAENFHIVEKLKSDVMNLSTKIELLESELEETKNQLTQEKEEGIKWKERCKSVEAEREKLKAEFEKKIFENTELGKALTDRNEEIKKVENERELLQNASKEKIETESKLKEYVEKYNKLESENRTLQNDLMEKCGKLLKDLNESKDKLKQLEAEGKAKTKELESLKKKHLGEDKKKSKEIQELKKEWENLKADTSINQQKFAEELNKLKCESEELRVAAAETTTIRIELQNKDEELKKLKTELETLEQKTKGLEELDQVKKERTQEKEANERLKNELEALRGNLKGELKEKEEKSILVDKLTLECNLLLAEIENLKKIHSANENKLENELQASRKEYAEQINVIQKLEENLVDRQRELESKSIELEKLGKKCQVLGEENESLKQSQNKNESLISESASDAEKTKSELIESEKIRQELSEKVFKLTNETNEAYGELQMKQNELETLRNSLKSLRDEFAEKEKIFEREKLRLLSENENKLNVLKNEIKFINTKHEEDIGNFEENLNSEMKEANEKIEIAEKTSAELLDKLEKVTNERDELKVIEEEKNLKVAELENCMMALKAELDDRFNDDANDDNKKHNEAVKEIIMQYDKEVAERDEEIEALKLKLADAEDLEEIKMKHSEEVKQIIMQYDNEIGQRDDEIEMLKSKISEHAAALEHLKSTNQDLEMMKKNLAEKDELIQVKLEEEEKLKKELESRKTKEIVENEKTGEDKLREQKVEFEKMLEAEKTKLREELIAEKNRELAEEKKNWEQKYLEMKKQHQKEGNDKKEWNSQKNKSNLENTEVSSVDGLMEEVELEPVMKANVASLENSSSSIDVLQRQLIQQAAEMKELKRQYKKEIMELKKVSGKRKFRKNSSDNQEWCYTTGGLENDTEHEYLRNILYEYMMGKEQLVLAKVLSAIVKFNEEQTHSVLEKEQQRQTLLGQLGLL